MMKGVKRMDREAKFNSKSNESGVLGGGTCMIL